MIKIDLAKVKKKERKGFALDLKGIREINVQDLLKGGGEYTAGVVLWLVVLLVLGYYLKVQQEQKALRVELDRLNQEKAMLQARTTQVLEEKKRLEERIKSIRQNIQEIEKTRDVIVGLKAYYEPFNRALFLYTERAPRTLWMSSYRQSFDLNQQKIVSEFDVNSFDYDAISNYSKMVSSNSSQTAVTQIERRITPSGFEYYFAKISSEKSLHEER